MPRPARDFESPIDPPRIEPLEERMLLTTLHGGETFIYYNSQGETCRADMTGAWTDTVELFAYDMAKDVIDPTPEGLLDIPGSYLVNDALATEVRWPDGEPVIGYDDQGVPSWIEYDAAQGIRGARTEIYTIYVVEATGNTVLTISTLAISGNRLEGDRWSTDINPWESRSSPLLSDGETNAPDNSGGVIVGAYRSPTADDPVRHIAVPSDDPLWPEPEMMGAFPGGPIRPGMITSGQMFALMDEDLELGTDVQGLAMNTGGDVYAVDMDAYHATLVDTQAATDLGDDVGALGGDGTGTLYDVNNHARAMDTGSPSFGTDFQGLAIDPSSGYFYGIGDVTLLYGTTHRLRRWSGAGAIEDLGLLFDRYESRWQYRAVTALDFHPTQNTLYAIATIFSIDPAGPTVPDPAGPFLITIDLSDMVVDRGPLIQDVTNIPAMVFASDGTLYAVNGANNQLITIDPSTGATTVIADLTEPVIGGVTGVVGIEFIGETLYAATVGEDTPLGPQPGTVYRVDKVTGTCTDMLVNDQDEATSLAYDETYTPEGLYTIMSITDGEVVHRITLAASLMTSDDTAATTGIGGLWEDNERTFTYTDVYALDFNSLGTIVATGEVVDLDPDDVPDAPTGQYLLTINPTTGSVTRGSALAGVSDLSSLAVASGDTLAYASSSADDKLYVVNLADGTATEIGDLPAGVTGLELITLGSNDALFALAPDTLYAVDSTNASTTAIGTTDRDDLTSLTYDPTYPYVLWSTGMHRDQFLAPLGYRLARMDLSSTLVRSNAVDVTNRVARLYDSDEVAFTYIGVTGLDFDDGGSLQGVATLVNIDPYHVSAPPSDLHLVRINTTSGEVYRGPSLDVSGLSSITFDDSGVMYAVNPATSELVTANMSTGVTTVVGSLGVAGIVGIDFSGDGVLHAVTGQDLYTVDPSTGTATFVIDIDFPPPGLMTCLAADPVDATRMFTAIPVNGVYRLVLLASALEYAGSDFGTILIAGTVAGRFENPLGNVQRMQIGFLFGNAIFGRNVGDFIMREGGGARPTSSGGLLVPGNGSVVSVAGEVQMVDARGVEIEDMLYSSVLVTNDPSVEAPDELIMELEKYYPTYNDAALDIQWRLGEMVYYDNDSAARAQFLTSSTGNITVWGDISEDFDYYALPMLAGQTIHLEGGYGHGMSMDDLLYSFFYDTTKVLLYDWEGRWFMDSLGYESVEDWGVGSRGLTQEVMTFTAPAAGVYYLVVVQRDGLIILNNPYSLFVTDATPAAMGGVNVDGSYSSTFQMADGFDITVLNGGDFGAVTISQSSFYTMAKAIGGGDLVCFQAGEIGTIVSGVYTPNTIISEQNIGRVASTWGFVYVYPSLPYGVRAGVDAFGTVTNDNAYIQNIYAATDLIRGEISATGSIGAIETEGTIYFPVITVNSDLSEIPGDIGLIEIGLDWGSLGGTPTLVHGPEGNVGYVHVAGQIYVIHGGWIGLLEETTVDNGGSSILNDDGGGKLTIAPQATLLRDADGNMIVDENGQPEWFIPSYSYAVIPVEVDPNWPMGGVGGAVANLRVNGSAVLSVEGLVEIGNLDLNGPVAVASDPEDPGSPPTYGGPSPVAVDVCFTGTGTVKVYHAQSTQDINSLVNKSNGFGRLLSGQFANVNVVKWHGDIGREVDPVNTWLHGYDDAPIVGNIIVEPQYGWYHGKVQGLTINGDLQYLSVDGSLHDLRAIGTVTTVKVNADGMHDDGHWDGVKGIVWSQTRMEHIEVGDGLADDGGGEVAEALVTCTNRISSVYISGPRYEMEDVEIEGIPVETVVYGEINGSVMAYQNEFVAITDPYGNPAVQELDAIGQVVGENGAVLTALVGGMGLDAFRADGGMWYTSGSVNLVSFSGIGAEIYGAEIHAQWIRKVTTSVDSNGINYSFITGSMARPNELAVYEVLPGGPGMNTTFVSSNGGDLGVIRGLGPVADISNCYITSTDGLQSLIARDVHANNFQMPGTIESLTSTRDMYDNGTAQGHPWGELGYIAPEFGVGAIRNLTVGGHFTDNYVKIAGRLVKMTVQGNYVDSTLNMYGRHTADLQLLVVTGNISGSLISAAHIGSVISQTGAITAHIETDPDGWNSDVELIETALGYTGTMDVAGSVRRFVSHVTLGDNPETTGGTTQTFDIAGDLDYLGVGHRGTTAHLYAGFNVGGTIGTMEIHGTFYGDVEGGGDLHNLILDGTLGGWLDLDGDGTAEAQSGSLKIRGEIRSMIIPTNADILLTKLTVGGSIQSLTLNGGSIYSEIESVFGSIDRLVLVNGSLLNDVTARSFGVVQVTNGDITGNLRATAGGFRSLTLVDGNLNGNVTVDNGTIDALNFTDRTLTHTLTGTISASAGITAAKIIGYDLSMDMISQRDIKNLAVAGDVTGLVYAATEIVAMNVTGSVLNTTIRAAGRIGGLMITGNLTNSAVSSGWNINSTDIRGNVASSHILAGAGYGFGPDGNPGGGDDDPIVTGTVHSGTIALVSVGGSFDSSVISAGIDPGADEDYVTFADNSESTGHSDVTRAIVRGGYLNPTSSSVVAASDIDASFAALAGAAGVGIYDNSHGGAPIPIPASGTNFGAEILTPQVTFGSLKLSLLGPGIGNYDPVTGRLVLNRTTLASTLTIQYTGTGTYATIIDIVGSDDSQLAALRVIGNVTLGDITFDGTIKTMVVGSVENGATWNTTGDITSTTVNALTNVDVTAGEVGSWIVNGAYASGTFTADAIGTFRVNGAMGADLNSLLVGATAVQIAGAMSGDMTFCGNVVSMLITAGGLSGTVTVTNGDLITLQTTGDFTGAVDVQRGSSHSVIIAGGNFGNDLTATYHTSLGIATFVVQSGDFVGSLTTDADLTSLQVPSGGMTGRLWVAGSVGTVVLGSMDGASLSASCDIGTVRISGSMTDSFLISGFLPAWAAPDSSDHPSTGNIQSVLIGGDMIRSTISGAVGPGADGFCGTADDEVAGRGYVYRVTVVRGIYGSSTATDSYGVFASSAVPTVYHHSVNPFEQNGNAWVGRVPPNIALEFAAVLYLPDSVVGSVSYFQGAYFPGTELVLTFTEANLGGADLSGSNDRSIEIRLSSDLQWGNADDMSILILTDNSALNSGADRLITQGITIPAYASPGTYYVAIMADSGGAISESDEDNNVWWSPQADIQVRSVAPHFDEGFYLGRYPDVAAAVASGYFHNGFEHFFLYGTFEGRAPSDQFNEAEYLGLYDDVRAAVAGGQFRSGFMHYLLYGAAEGRDPSLMFNEAYYLARYADVRAAVQQGFFQSALDHYRLYGRYEGRARDFDEQHYLDLYPDVKDAVTTNIFESGLQHFILYGIYEGRDPCPLI